MTPEELDQKIKESAKLAIDIATENKSWIWGLFGRLLLLYSIWVVRRSLDKQATELVSARGAAELQRLEAQQALMKAQYAALAAKDKELEGSLANAAVWLAQVAANAEEIKRAECAHAERSRKIEQITSWENLNAIAGVK